MNCHERMEELQMECQDRITAMRTDYETQLATLRQENQSLQNEITELKNTMIKLRNKLDSQSNTISEIGKRIYDYDALPYDEDDGRNDAQYFS